MYSKTVLEIFNHPKNIGRISKPDGIASNFNLDNTANVEFSMRVNGGLISDCKFRAQANPYIVAICSTITEMVKGRMVSLLFIDPYSVTKNLGADENIDFGFCIDCVKMMIDDYSDKLEKSQKMQAKANDNPRPEKVEEESSEARQEDAGDKTTFGDLLDDDFDLDELI